MRQLRSRGSISNGGRQCPHRVAKDRVYAEKIVSRPALGDVAHREGNKSNDNGLPQQQQTRATFKSKSTTTKPITTTKTTTTTALGKRKIKAIVSEEKKTTTTTRRRSARLSSSSSSHPVVDIAKDNNDDDAPPSISNKPTRSITPNNNANNKPHNASSSTKEQHPIKYYYDVGTLISKLFIDQETGVERAYPGKVIRYDNQGSSKLYHVKYQDGDEEDLTVEELSEVVLGGPKRLQKRQQQQQRQIAGGGTSNSSKRQQLGIVTGSGKKSKKKSSAIAIYSDELSDKKSVEDDNSSNANNNEVMVINGVENPYNDPPRDIDELDVDQPEEFIDYIDELYDHYRSSEKKTSVCGSIPLANSYTYMNKQPNVEPSTRQYLIERLVTSHVKWRCLPETLYLCVNILDRYLENEVVPWGIGQLNLVGAGAMLIASKYEERWCVELPHLRQFAIWQFREEEIVKMETKILESLNFKVYTPTVHHFQGRFLKAAQLPKIHDLSSFILDGTLQSYTLLKYRPSQLAAASVYIARKVHYPNARGWSPTLWKHTQYTEEDVMTVARDILLEHDKLYATGAVKEKYSKEKFGNVSNMHTERRLRSVLQSITQDMEDSR